MQNTIKNLTVPGEMIVLGNIFENGKIITKPEIIKTLFNHNPVVIGSQ